MVDALKKGMEKPAGPQVPYCLDGQVGFLLRQSHQRHATIFARMMIEGMTPTQWAALSKIAETGPLSQNLLGRNTAMDAATIKGVVDRLVSRGLVEARAMPSDNRRKEIALTQRGQDVVRAAAPIAHDISRETLASLSASEQQVFLRLLGKMI